MKRLYTAPSWCCPHLHPLKEGPSSSEVTRPSAVGFPGGPRWPPSETPRMSNKSKENKFNFRCNLRIGAKFIFAALQGRKTAGLSSLPFLVSHPWHPLSPSRPSPPACSSSLLSPLSSLRSYVFPSRATPLSFHAPPPTGCIPALKNALLIGS